MTNQINQIIIYKIYCKFDSVCNNGYIGSTVNLTRRKHFHKVNCGNLNKKCELYTAIREHGGWANWQMDKIESFEFVSEANTQEVVQRHILKSSYYLSISEPSQKYMCDCCNLDCSDKSNYNKHCQTQKHLNIQKNINQHQQYMNDQMQQERNQFKEQIDKKEEEFQKQILMMQQEQMQKQEHQLDAVMNVMKKNEDLTTQLVEMSKEKTTINNTNNITNKFNLNIFLNETCKYALNLDDFMKQIKYNVDDLVRTGEIGFSGGMSHIFINGLQYIEADKRPIHCSDLKRGTLYIRENDKWEKEDPEKSHIMAAMRELGRGNLRTLPQWIERHPNYRDYDSKENTEYMRIVGNAMPGLTDDEMTRNYKKAIHSISCEVTIPKTED